LSIYLANKKIDVQVLSLEYQRLFPEGYFFHAGLANFASQVDYHWDAFESSYDDEATDIIVKVIKNGTLSIPWAKPGGASVSLTSTSVKPRSGSASQNAVPGHLNQESPSDQQVSLNREFKMTYSTDFHRRVIARVRSGDGKNAVCRLFGISRSTVDPIGNRTTCATLGRHDQHRKPQ